VVRDNRGGHNRKTVNVSFFKEWSPEMAYVLGFIYADGAVEDCRESSRTCYLSMTNTDLRLLEKIRDVMSSNHNIYVRKGGSVIIRGRKYNQKDCHVFRIGNKMMYQDLINIGLCPRKSLIIALPDIPANLFNYFLRGYFDGDGCIHIEKIKMRMRIIFTSGSKVFLDQIYEILGLIGFIRQNGGAYRLVYGGKAAEMVTAFMYNEISLVPYLEYKYHKYEMYLKEKSVNRVT